MSKSLMQRDRHRRSVPDATDGGNDATASDRLPQTQRAYREIRRRILDNEMPPNAQYLEQELANALGMSRTPVREALIRLSDERLVEVRPRHGARVLPVFVEDMREIYELVTELEAMAARMVAERGLSAKEIQQLEQAVADMDAALERDDLIGWAHSDEQFHTLLVDLARNSRLSQVVAMFRDQAHRARMQTLRLRPKPVESNRDHAAVVDAIRKRDGDTAATIHRRHRQKAGAMLLRLLARCGSEGL
jgi:DNA-binding GntR family transcriptional regulator